ncbi:MAG: anthranilate synthase component I [Dehalococcoidia bacterium]
MYYPDLDQFKALATKGNIAPIYREIPADMETPATAYLKVAHEGPSFLLESVEGGERVARYSFIGTLPNKVFSTGQSTDLGDIDPLVNVEKALSDLNPVAVEGLPRFLGGAVGFIAYDAVRHFEPSLKPNNNNDPMGVPDSIFMMTDTILIFDHVKHVIKVVSDARLDGDIDQNYQDAVGRIDLLVERLTSSNVFENKGLKPGDQTKYKSEVESNHSKEDYMSQVQDARHLIESGEVIQVVLSQRLSRETSAAPFDIYRALRALNPSPYMYYLDFNDFHIIGSSPETLVRVEDGIATSDPIAGTRPRGSNKSEDEKYAEDLINDEKERAEHVMLVDLARNDIGKVSEPGTVKVEKFMEIARYSHVMHIASNVSGKLKSDLTSFDALRSCFPAGTLSGAPKVRAMEIIGDKEPHARGPYGGAVGYFSHSGNMDMAICIRTVVMKDGVATVQAGAGLVYDSVPETEFEECLHKARGMMNAIDQAEEFTNDRISESRR